MKKALLIIFVSLVIYTLVKLDMFISVDEISYKLNNKTEFKQ